MSNIFNIPNIKTVLKTGFTVPEILDLIQVILQSITANKILPEKILYCLTKLL